MKDDYIEKRFQYLKSSLKSSEIDLDFDKESMEALNYVGALFVRNELGAHDELIYFESLSKGDSIESALGKAFLNHIFNESIKSLE